MSDQEILEKAIQKALDGGWRPRGFTLEDGTDLYGDEEISTFDIYRYGLKKVTFFNHEAVRFFIPVWEIIFNHSFAKALWGEGLICIDGGQEIWQHMEHYHCNIHDDCPVQPAWSYRVVHMVLADDPIKYLGENLE